MLRLQLHFAAALAAAVVIVGLASMAAGAVGSARPCFRGERLDRWIARWRERPLAVLRAWHAVALALGGALAFAGT